MFPCLLAATKNIRRREVVRVPTVSGANVLKFSKVTLNPTEQGMHFNFVPFECPQIFLTSVGTNFDITITSLL